MDYFFSRKKILKYRCQTVNFTIFVSLVYMEGKIFLHTPNFRIFVSLVKWKKFFCKNLVKYPNKSTVTFQYNQEDFYFLRKHPHKQVCKCPIYMESVLNFFSKNLVFVIAKCLIIIGGFFEKVQLNTPTNSLKLSNNSKMV